MRRGQALSGAVALPTAAPLIVYDDVCVLCSRFVRWVVRHDREAVFRFTSAQGVLGEALYRDIALDPARLETVLLVVDGRVLGKAAAVAETGRRLGGIWRMLGALDVLPPGISDAAYDLVARNRYRLFGRRETCWLPPPEIAARIV